MTEKQAEHFFETLGNQAIMTTAGAHFTVEELYQAIYRRLFDERATHRHVHEEPKTRIESVR